MSNGFPTLTYDLDEDEEMSRYGDKTSLLYYEVAEDINPGDNLDIVDDEGNRLGGGYVDYILHTPIHRLPTLPIEGIPDFEDIEDAVEYFNDGDIDVDSADIATVVGLYNVRWVGGYV